MKIYILILEWNQIFILYHQHQSLQSRTTRVWEQTVIEEILKARPLVVKLKLFTPASTHESKPDLTRISSTRRKLKLKFRWICIFLWTFNFYRLSVRFESEKCKIYLSQKWCLLIKFRLFLHGSLILCWTPNRFWSFLCFPKFWDLELKKKFQEKCIWYTPPKLVQW